MVIVWFVAGGGPRCLVVTEPSVPFLLGSQHLEVQQKGIDTILEKLDKDLRCLEVIEAGYQKYGFPNQSMY